MTNPVAGPTLVVWGMLGSLPFGGMAWQVYHYVVGLRRLGFDVWYVEDSDRPVYDPVFQSPTSDFTANVDLLAQYMHDIGMQDRWVFRPPGEAATTLGSLDHAGLQRLYKSAVGALNICGAQEPLESHAVIPCRVYVETDPVENQVAVARGHQGVISTLEQHDFHFTYGENLPAAGTPVPMERFTWHPTRPPVCVDLWTTTERAENPALTTIAKWNHSSTDIAWKGYDSKDVRWGDHVWRWSKHHEFQKVQDLPSRVECALEMALGSSPADRAMVEELGWRTRDPAELNRPDAYRGYIRGSTGEFTVAKDQYVAPGTGWFSDRSVCYLAAGRPVITQETGFSRFLPTGEGLVSFSGLDDAVAAVEDVMGDYPRHSRAAAEIAREHFGAEGVLTRLLTTAGLL